VLIESREHDGDLATYSVEHAHDVLLALRERVRVHERTADVRAVIAFRNRGRRAGSSQPHPHMQIAALGVVPPAVALRAKDAAVLVDAIARERHERVRVVRDEGGVLAWCPFASGRAWETRLALEAPCARFSELEDARVPALAAALVDVCARLRIVLGEHDSNVLLRDPPVGVRTSFFTLDVLPRTGGDAGFELGSGMGICVVAPEDAAAELGELGGTRSPL
jgi:UDPglucose--hexose-1-phosphate uridylyltransferase